MELRSLKASAPGHVEYALTALGKTLEQPLTAICDWAAGTTSRPEEPMLRC
jgi:DNA-binding HxlR family transcriptional regulator